MKNTEKLKVVFDFIADYLSEGEVSNESNVKEETITEETTVEELSMTEEDGKFKRAYSIMKKMDEMDKQSAFTSRAVQDAKKPLEEAITRVRESLSMDKTVEDLTADFKEKTGVTLDKDGHIAEVKVGPLKEYTTIKEIMESTK